MCCVLISPSQAPAPLLLSLQQMWRRLCEQRVAALCCRVLQLALLVLTLHASGMKTWLDNQHPAATLCSEMQGPLTSHLMLEAAAGQHATELRCSGMEIHASLLKVPAHTMQGDLHEGSVRA